MMLPVAWLFALLAGLLTISAAQMTHAADEPAGKSDAQSAAAAPTPSEPLEVLQAVSVPAARAAKNVAVITIHGQIDEWSERSVRRRIRAAEAAGADAIVFDIDTPGGHLGAMLAISSTIKSSSIKNTLAWVNPNAYSAGSVIAMACREIAVNDGAAFGDALPIEISMLEGLKPIPDAEREKVLGPVMADLVDSARKNGQDELLVQGFVRRGVELWLVEHTETGQRLFVTAEQFKLATGNEPERGTAAVPAITGAVDTSESGPVGPAMPRRQRSGVAAADADEDTAYIPAAPNVSPTLRDEVNQELAMRGTASTRPDLRTPEHKGKYRGVEYVASGAGVLTFHTDEMLRYRIATEKVRNDTDLKAYFGATNMTRLDETWSEDLSRFLSQFWVRGLLIVIFIIALFIEMVHPGLILPGSIAGLALIALVVPPILVNMAAWWMVAAILGGVLMIMLELFVLPGTGVFGVAGALCLFGGLVGAAVGGPQNLFPGATGMRGDLTIGLLTALISLVVAFIAIGVIARNLPTLPFLDRIVLKDDPDAAPTDLAYALAAQGAVKPGTIGVAITPLRPSGRVQIGDDIIDVVAEMGMISPGTPVRVVSVDAFRTVVEAVEEPRQDERDTTQV